MWSRYELKAAARETLRRCYLAAVLVCLIVSLLTGGQNSDGFGLRININTHNGLEIKWGWDDDENDPEDFFDRDERQEGSWSLMRLAERIFELATGVMIATLGLAAALAGIALRLLVGNALSVGGNRFFVKARREHGSLSELLFSFQSGYYVNIILVMFFRQLKTWLWSLLFVIPGIVKHYEYCMIPYLMAENPSMSRQRAFELSREMMDGQKMEVFFLDLSFLPWMILSAFTCGLVNLFWTNPYMAAAKAELYERLRADALARGLTDSFELPGF